jgi:hypothetical protein
MPRGYPLFDTTVLLIWPVLAARRIILGAYRAHTQRLSTVPDRRLKAHDVRHDRAGYFCLFVGFMVVRVVGARTTCVI